MEAARAARRQWPFRSTFLGGFECSSHRRAGDRRRLDMIAATLHDALAESDYRLLRAHGLLGARDGLRWHRIETRPGRYDWSSFVPMLRAARAAGVDVLWDLLHWGWPDDIDIWSAAFVDRFAAFARAAVRVMRDEGAAPPLITPVNEMSFWAWAGGDMGRWPPFATGRGDALKLQLARAAIAAIHAVREEEPRAVIATSEPLVNVVVHPSRPEEADQARAHHDAQYHATDMLLGAREPQLGGSPELVDLVGLNYYCNNQWFLGSPTIFPGQPHHRPLSELLAEAHARHGRPLYLSETGTEGSFRAAWLHYVGQEVAAARAAGVPVGGICLYPILCHPGWDDERHCPNGLFDDARAAYAPLAEELSRQRVRLGDERGAARTAA